jgi:hypothetical protein
MIDRSEVSRALAKAIAFKQCNRHAEAAWWAARLLGLLQCAEIINPDRVGLLEAAYPHEGDPQATRTMYLVS